jgi:hypothetical protein
VVTRPGIMPVAEKALAAALSQCSLNMVSIRSPLRSMAR